MPLPPPSTELFKSAVELVERAQEDKANAKPLLSKALRLLKQSLLESPDKAVSHFVIGLILQRSDWEAAAASYRACIELKPAYFSAQHNLGYVLSKQGDFQGAISAYKAALEIEPFHAKALSNLGNQLRLNGDLSGAIALYEEAVTSEPQHASAHYNLGLALHTRDNSGDVEAAIIAYQDALSLEPQYWPAHHNLGCALLDRKDVDGAIACFRTVLELDPENLRALLNLGDALQQQDDTDGAYDAYSASSKLNPSHHIVDIDSPPCHSSHLVKRDAMKLEAARECAAWFLTRQSANRKAKGERGCSPSDDEGSYCCDDLLAL
jgi:tetratricopeptide (TPR) repeat protein